MKNNLSYLGKKNQDIIFPLPNTNKKNKENNKNNSAEKKDSKNSLDFKGKR